MIQNFHLHMHIFNMEYKCVTLIGKSKNYRTWCFWDTVWIKRIVCWIAPRLTTTVYTLIRNTKGTDMLSTTHTCIKAFRLCHLAVSCMSTPICEHISRTLGLIIISLVTNTAYMRNNTVNHSLCPSYDTKSLTHKWLLNVPW